MKRLGLEMEDVEAAPHEVWPENWDMWLLFSRMVTQWRNGFNGPTGLDYCAVYPLIDRMADADDWDYVLDVVRLMEAEALETMRDNREAKRG